MFDLMIFEGIVCKVLDEMSVGSAEICSGLQFRISDLKNFRKLLVCFLILGSRCCLTPKVVTEGPTMQIRSRWLCSFIACNLNDI